MTGVRGVQSALHRRPRLRLAGLLAPPMAWLVVAYLGSLLLLFVTAFWTTDSFTGVGRRGVHAWTTSRRSSPRRSTGIVAAHRRLALAVTVICVLIARARCAFYMAKVASPRMRPLLVDRGADPAVGQLPGQGLRLADDASPTESRLAAGARLRPSPGLRPARDGPHADLPVAART